MKTQEQRISKVVKAIDKLAINYPNTILHVQTDKGEARYKFSDIYVVSNSDLECIELCLGPDEGTVMEGDRINQVHDATQISAPDSLVEEQSQLDSLTFGDLKKLLPPNRTLNFRGSVETVEDLPHSKMYDVWYVASTRSSYIYLGHRYVRLIQ